MRDKRDGKSSSAWLWSGLVLITLVSVTSTSAREPLKAELSLKQLDGKNVHLHDYLGKIVVLNFWATWCGPCREEMPLLAEAEKEYRPRGIVFIGASLDDAKSRAEIPAFVQTHHIDFPVLVGATVNDLDRLEMGPAVPATAFIDPDGRIVARVEGEIRTEELKERLDWLLHGQAGNPPQARIIHFDEKH